MDAQESQIFTAIVIAAIIMAGIIGYFIFPVVKQQKKVLDIQRRNANAEITALEKDRARIADNLHDEISPMLSAVKMRISSFELSDTADQIQLEKANQTIYQIANRLREISFALMPAALLQKGLVVALQEFINIINIKEGLAIYLSYTEKPLVLNQEKSIHIYRAVQEIIQNTLKHAKATKLNIELKVKKDTLVLISKDNGIGFNYKKELEDAAGFGIRSLQNRVNLLQGNFSVQSTLEKGTFYKIEIPLKTNNNL